MRKIGAVGLAVVAVALVAIAIPSTITALRARGAVISSCDDSLAALPYGTWVRLKDCRVDMFHSSFLDDAAGMRSHRLAPLRAAGTSAQEPSSLALAVGVALASDPDVYRNTPRSDSAESQVADLGETVGVVWSNLDRLTLTHALVTVHGIDTGLVPSPVLIELQQVPALREPGALILAALVAGVLALVVLRYRPSARVAPSLTPATPPRPAVRWGLVFLAVLVGMVALWRGLFEYFDPMQQAPPTFAEPRPQPTRAGVAPSAIPEPTQSELLDLGSSDRATQLKAANALLTRAETPALVAAVESAFQKNPAPDVEARLVCLKSRFKGPESLEFVLNRFPKERKDLTWNLKPEVSCMLDALAARALEAPERIRDALMPAIYAGNITTQGKAHAAFRKMDLPQIPAMLLAEASTTGSLHQREALRAALALGAMRLNPALVAGAIRDASTSPVVREELRTDPHPNAARIVAQAWVERSFESELARLGREREQNLHDVSAGLLEIVLDPSAPEGHRIAGANHLAVLSDAGPLHGLRRLSSTLDPGRLKTAVDAAIGVLEERVKQGRRAEMRTLPPREAGRD